MFRLNRLEEQYQEAVSADLQEWERLVDAVRLIGTGFSNYLASSEDSNDMGNMKPRIIFGTANEDHSINADLSKLFRVGRDVYFSLRLDLAEKPTEIPPSFFIFRLKVKPLERGFGVTDVDANEDIPLENGLVSVFQYLYKTIQKRMAIN